MNNEEKLIEFLKNNHGYISTSELLELKIYKPQIRFYINKGIIEATSPFGNPVKVYNAERCICDMLRSEKEFDLELQNRVLDYYFSSKDKNIELLLEYSKIFNINEK